MNQPELCLQKYLNILFFFIDTFTSIFSNNKKQSKHYMKHLQWNKVFTCELSRRKRVALATYFNCFCSAHPHGVFLFYRKFAIFHKLM